MTPIGKWLQHLFVGMLVITTSIALAADKPVALNYTCNNFLPEFQRCSTFVQRWSDISGIEVKLREKFWLTNDELTFIRQILAVHNSTPDIFMVDVIWTEQLAEHFIDFNTYLSKDSTKLHFPRILENNTDSKGHLVALPLFSSVGMLYYRSDLLQKYNRPVPTTWEELAETATYIVSREKSSNPELVGFVWQGRDYEGLTCAALEWIHSYGGGTIIDEQGRITINNSAAATALKTAAGWVGTISPKEVLEFTEEEARIVFQNGNAVFMRSWPFVLRMANHPKSKIRGRIGATEIPKGGIDGVPGGTLGGWNLAVSRYSEHIKEAVELSRFMTDQHIQVERALVSGVLPTVISGYADQQLADDIPFLREVPNWLEHAVRRPSKVTGKKYNKVSRKFYLAVKDVLMQRLAAEEALSRLEKEIILIKGENWLN